MERIFNVTVDELLKEEGIEMNENNNPIDGGKKDFSKNTIIVIVLIIVLVCVIGGVTYEVIKKINEKKVADEIFDTYNKISGQVTDKISSQQSDITEKMKEQQAEFNKKVEKQQAEFDKNSYNSKYINLYTGLKNDFETESAIEYVIQDNINNDRKITVKYNGTEAVESKDLTKLISSLKKDQYLISYEYDEEGYINVMNIEDV